MSAHPTRRALLMVAAMAGAAALADRLKPRAAAHGQGPELGKLIPTAFGDWQEDRSFAPVSVDPTVEVRLEVLYDQTLGRTYVNAAGQRVMLSLAYGANQSRDLQVHRPEVCYASQGFSVSAQTKAVFDCAVGQIPVMRLVATRGERVEPITYWVRLGRYVVRGNLEQGMARLAEGLRGHIADGMLVRISNISPHSEQAFALHEAFATQLVSALSSPAIAMLLPTGLARAGASAG
jgi:EpsI family protein